MRVPPPPEKNDCDYKFIISEDLCKYAMYTIVCFIGEYSVPHQYHIYRDRLHICGIKNFMVYSSDKYPQKHRRWGDSYLSDYLGELIAVYDLLEDHESKLNYLRFLKSIITGCPGYIFKTHQGDYSHPKITISKNDIIIDAGVSAETRGIEKFANQLGPSGKIYGFEPEISNYTAAKTKLENTALTNIELINLGLYSHRASLPISARGVGSSVVWRDADCDNMCALVSLDEFVNERALPGVDVIKMDIEGAERAALAGARQTIMNFAPKLLISLYHLPEDLFAIPLFINSLGLGYKFYIIQQTWRCIDSVLVGVPPVATRGKWMSSAQQSPFPSPETPLSAVQAEEKPVPRAKPASMQIIVGEFDAEGAARSAFPSPLQRVCIAAVKPVIKIIVRPEFYIKLCLDPSDTFAGTGNVFVKLFGHFLGLLGPKPQKTGYKTVYINTLGGRHV